MQETQRYGFSSFVGKIPWRRAWQPTPVFLPGESHGQRSLWATVYRVQRVGHDRSNLAHMLLEPVNEFSRVSLQNSTVFLIAINNEQLQNEIKATLFTMT